MVELEQKFVDVLEEQGWKICSYTGDGRVELETYSPAGEDFVMVVEIEDFPKEVFEYYQDFDVDEHVSMWINAKREGVSGVPSARVLVHDAEEIEKMLLDLADALADACRKE